MSSDLSVFKAWLIKRGAIIEPPTSEWELLRVRSCFGTHVIYQNKKGGQTWPKELKFLHADFLSKKDVRLSPDQKGRVKLRHTISQLAKRDGLWCWFCELPFPDTDADDITIEHLVPKSHGGPDHASNLVLACEICNLAAGNLSVAEKVAIRDQKRGFVCEPVRACA